MPFLRMRPLDLFLPDPYPWERLLEKRVSYRPGVVTCASNPSTLEMRLEDGV